MFCHRADQFSSATQHEWKHECIWWTTRETMRHNLRIDKWIKQLAPHMVWGYKI